MNFRNRKLLIVLRTLFGLFLIMSGVTGLMAGPEMNGVPAPMVETQKQLYHMGIFHMIKGTELVAGIMLVIGLLPWLAAIFVAPIAIGIMIYTSRVAPPYAITGLIVCLFEAYLGYAYWDKYKKLFERA